MVSPTPLLPLHQNFLLERLSTFWSEKKVGGVVRVTKGGTELHNLSWALMVYNSDQREMEERDIIPAVTPVVVDHWTQSTFYWFATFDRSVHMMNCEGFRWLNDMVRYRGGQPCLSEAQDVAVPYVPLEVDPGPEVIQLVLQGLDIG